MPDEIISSISIASWTMDANGNFGQVHPSASELFAAPLSGACWLDFIPPSHRPAALEALKSADQSRQTVRLDHPLLRGDGATRSLLTAIVPGTLLESPLPGFLAFGVDLTPLRAPAVRLRQLSLAAEESPAAILVADSNGAIEYVNSRFTALTGYTAEEVIGQNPRFLKSGETSPQVYRVMWNQLTAGREWRGEFLNKRKDGTLFWESAVIAPVFNPSGAITHYVAVKEDITERKRLAAAVAEAERRALAAERAKSDFLQNMSHEFRTPMNGILGMAGLIDQSALDPDSRYCLQVLTQSAHALLALLQEVLDYTNLASAPPELAAAPFSLADCLDQSASLFLAAAHEKSIDIHTYFAPGLPSTLHGDCLHLAQVLACLIGNAIKFATSGIVKLSVELASPLASSASVELRFAVSDQGPGMDPETLARIFEPFEQGDPSLVRRHSGAGLGLSIARRLVEAMHGRLWAESRPGRGSTFYFTASFPRPPAS